MEETRNTGASKPGSGLAAPTRTMQVSGDEVQNLLAKLNSTSSFLPLMPYQELLSPEHYSENEKHGKHVLQEASIIGHLARIGALGPQTTRAIELGAGTGRLSDRLQRITCGRLGHILVDRQEFKPRSCRDRSMQARLQKMGAPEEGRVVRIVSDIASFDFDSLSSEPSTVGDSGGAGNSEGNSPPPPHPSALCMSKHLCGPACDLALAALGRVSTQGAGMKERNERRPFCCLATCCHYLCTWDTFHGREFWLAFGLTQEDFKVAVATTQWATLKATPSSPSIGSSSSSSSRRDGRKGDSIRVGRSGQETATNAAAADNNGADDGEENSEWLPDFREVVQRARAALDRSRAGPVHEGPGFGNGSSNDDEDPGTKVDKRNTSPRVPSAEFERTFSRVAKAALGRRAKELLDLCRAAWLQQALGYRVKLVRFTTNSVEDRLLVASCVGGGVQHPFFLEREVGAAETNQPPQKRARSPETGLLPDEPRLS